MEEDLSKEKRTSNRVLMVHLAYTCDGNNVKACHAIRVVIVAFLPALMVHSAYVMAQPVITKAFRDEVHFYQPIVL